MLKIQSSKQWVSQVSQVNDWVLLCLWVFIGSILRFTNLAAKPPWTDEFATMVFSLGNNFTSVPLNQVISLDTLLQPLRLNADANIGDIVSLLLREDNHPPLYFVLVNLWVKLFPSSGEYVDVWVMRSLPALLGVLSIPAVYFLAKIAFRSRLIAQISAALMAVSSYGIFLAQEARHYTLAILFVIASLICLVVSLRHLYQQTLIPLWLVFSWILINSLGLSVHYFFCLTLVGEAITLGILSYFKFQQNVSASLQRNLIRILLVIVGTTTTGLIWMFVVIPQGYGNNMITWIHPLSHILYAISPPFQLFAVWVPMISLLPVESDSIPVVILSGLILLLFFIWFIPYINRGIKTGMQLNQFRLPLLILMTFIAGVISLFLIITYVIGQDLTRAARYSFTYFPAVMVLVGASLGILWNEVKPENIILQQKKTLNPLILLRKLYDKLNSNGKLAFTAVWVMGFLGAITVMVNLGYQKYYRPEQFISVIKETASQPVLIATTHKSLVQTGEMMGIGLELHNKSELENISFLLIHQEQDNSPETTKILQQTVENISDPLEVWTVNFNAPIDFKNCTVDVKNYPYIDGYGYKRYICN
ncbi:glycosyltransferase family 39 protein [Crocosphaera sp. XPORK-15E]|uniref:glycosyltransferase family 39 protein n=1 Tax=Crocosphaera sp. XPORK-15E TaxID=3110247 RepID=UPI002B1EE66E|nr:phospholipid carrier-dependent glycosyltransferase [Crocosphaera sp. XPORK-15E]MEA5535880.1 phospholipid carrier-dependent glycosyltransferase [Crocosphaera sp. XPORK-15E]